jgi:hypothetical protein
LWNRQISPRSGPGVLSFSTIEASVTIWCSDIPERSIAA